MCREEAKCRCKARGRGTLVIAGFYAWGTSSNGRDRNSCTQEQAVAFRPEADTQAGATNVRIPPGAEIGFSNFKKEVWDRADSGRIH